MKNKKILTFLFLFFLAGIGFSQGGGSYGFVDATSLGMGRTYTASSLGINALGINPANISIPTGNSVWIKSLLILPTINLSLQSPLDIDSYNYYFGGSGVKDSKGKEIGRTLTESEKTALGSMLTDNEFNLTMNFDYLSFIINLNPSVGSFAFSISDKISQNFKLNKSFADLFFGGVNKNSEYGFSDLNLKTSGYREYALSYAREITTEKFWIFDKTYGGLSLKMVNGFFYINTITNNSQFTLDDKYVLRGNWDYEVQTAFSPDFGTNYGKDSVAFVTDNISAFPASAGSGFGFDIGFTGIINKIIKVSFAITDIGSISWSSNTAVIKGSGDLVFSGYNSKEAIDSITDKLEKIDNKLNSEFSSSLPTALRIGVAYQLDKAPFISSFPGRMLVAFDYNQGFNEEPGNSKTPRVSFGVDYRPSANWYVPALRTGFSFGGKMGSEWIFGLGFEGSLFHVNFAFNPISIFDPMSFKKFQYAMDSKWRF